MYWHASGTTTAITIVRYLHRAILPHTFAGKVTSSGSRYYNVPTIQSQLDYTYHKNAVAKPIKGPYCIRSVMLHRVSFKNLRALKMM